MDEKKYEIKIEDEDKFVEVEVKIKVYLPEGSKKTGFLDELEVERLLMKRERTDLGEDVLNSFCE